MLNSLKRIREQQSLSIEFVSSMLKTDTKSYLQYENGEKVISEHEMSRILRLYGVEIKDVYPESIDIDVSKIGLARTYSSVTNKDKIAITKLINFRKNIVKKG